MAAKSPLQFHNFWGAFTDPTELPNVAAATLQDYAVEEGDTAYSESDTQLYYCTDASYGAAVWTSSAGTPSAEIFEIDTVNDEIQPVLAEKGRSFVVGSQSTEDTGVAADDTRLFFSKSDGSFRAGICTNTNWDAANRGTNSVALGYGTLASGDYSQAEGLMSQATYDASHAEGYYSRAQANWSHAEGYATRAEIAGSHTEGINTSATGQSATYYGDGGAHAEGYATTATGRKGSHAEGHYTNAGGDASHAEGRNTDASGNWTHAEGYSTTASGYKSHAEGDRSTASGESSHASGCLTIASGECSHTSGNRTTASGEGSQSSGLYSFARLRGCHAVASGYFSAIGDGQNLVLSAGIDTLDATPAPLTLDYSAVASDLAMETGSVWGFTAQVVGKTNEATGDSFFVELIGLVHYDGTDITLIGVSSPLNPRFQVNTAGAAGWSAQVLNVVAGNNFVIEVTGQAATVVRWVSRMTITEVTHV